MANPSSITALVLAAGLSTRMGGHPKPLLPLGNRTVLEHILTALSACPVGQVIVVTGHCHQAVEELVARGPARSVFNPEYSSGEMLTSIQVGLRSAPAESDAAMIVLGDQPALDVSVVERVIAAYRAGKGSVVIPSYQMRRGHPILIGRNHWDEILKLGEGQTLRDFMKSVGAQIHHVEVDTPAILRDMDTPADYRRELAEYAHSIPVVAAVPSIQ